MCFSNNTSISALLLIIIFILLGCCSNKYSRQVPLPDAKTPIDISLAQFS